MAGNGDCKSSRRQRRKRAEQCFGLDIHPDRRRLLPESVKGGIFKCRLFGTKSRSAIQTAAQMNGISEEEAFDRLLELLENVHYAKFKGVDRGRVVSS